MPKFLFKGHVQVEVKTTLTAIILMVILITAIWILQS